MLEFIIALIIVGAALYLLKLAPLDETVKTVIQVIVIVVMIIYAIKLLAPMAGLS